MSKKGCCRECKYADWDADGCTCMIDGLIVCNASDYTCDQYRPAKPLTNADRIRQMTDEELAKILCFAECEELCPAINNKHCNGDCCGHFLRWLKQEAEDAGTDD